MNVQGLELYETEYRSGAATQLLVEGKCAAIHLQYLLRVGS